MKKYFLPSVLWPLLFLASPGLSQAGVYYPDSPPGAARVETRENAWVLRNELLEARYGFKEGKLVFLGMLARGKEAAAEGGELFVVKTKDGRVFPASSMKLARLPVAVALTGDQRASRLSDRNEGQALEAVFTAPDQSLRVIWRAVLRDGSHYLRHEMSVESVKDIDLAGIVGMQYRMGPQPSVSGNTRGSVVVTETAFAGLETPMAKNTVLPPGGEPVTEGTLGTWGTGSWQQPGGEVPETLSATYGDGLVQVEMPLEIRSPGDCHVTFTYRSGHFRLNVAGVELLDDQQVVASDFHPGFAGINAEGNTYVLPAGKTGNYRVRCWVETKSEQLGSEGRIDYMLAKQEASDTGKGQRIVQGLWDRHATLKKGQPWKLSSVLGVFVPGQKRRSFQSYVERERAVPYRPFVHYNSWFELNVDTNNDPDPLKRMVEEQCLDVMKVWYDKMYTKRGVNLDAFVWDDGWDDFNTLWDFHKGFPRGFKAVSAMAARQKAGIGAWLGPVGGYYQSKQMRIASWNKNHPKNQIANFELSNEEYYQAFRARCTQMIRDYDMRYFKLDGISTMATTSGPDEKREEDAEGILRLAADLRAARKDVFLNCTVGTWASPFWYRYVDSVWRQGADWSQAGQGNSREKWITYRDQTIWEVFVKGAPLCPINSIMFHGLVVSKNGAPAHMPNDDVQSIKNELRCAFASGSGLQELYVDHAIMTGLKNEVLWDELARSIRWFRRHAAVLADTHWVGGAPGQGEVYGWASWMPGRAVLALRNPSGDTKRFSFTLREVLELPRTERDRMTLLPSYDDQRDIPGMTGTPLDPDATLTVELKPFEVVVFDSE